MLYIFVFSNFVGASGCSAASRVSVPDPTATPKPKARPGDKLGNVHVTVSDLIMTVSAVT